MRKFRRRDTLSITGVGVPRDERSGLEDLGECVDWADDTLDFSGNPRRLAGTRPNCDEFLSLNPASGVDATRRGMDRHIVPSYL